MGSDWLHLQASLGIKAESFFIQYFFSRTNTREWTWDWVSIEKFFLGVSFSLLYLSNHLPSFKKKLKLAGRHWSKGLISWRLNQSAIRALSTWNWGRERCAMKGFVLLANY